MQTLRIRKLKEEVRKLKEDNKKLLGRRKDAEYIIDSAANTGDNTKTSKKLADWAK